MMQKLSKTFCSALQNVALIALRRRSDIRRRCLSYAVAFGHDCERSSTKFYL